MFEFNPKLLLFIPATVIFYKLLNQKEEVNEEDPYPYFEYQKNFQRSLTYNRFEKPKLPNRKLKTRKKLFKIMDDSIKNREVKEILNNIIDKVVVQEEKRELKKLIMKQKEKERQAAEEKKKINNISYLSYFNISRFISRNYQNDNIEKQFEKVDLSSDGSFDKLSDISKISEFSKISKISQISQNSEFSKIDEEIK